MKYFALVAAMLAVALCSPAVAAEDAPSQADVLQGGVARWSEMNAETCGIFGKRYTAIEGVCYFPIDMDAKVGTHEIALYDKDGKQHLGSLNVLERECTEANIELPDETYFKLSDENRARAQRERPRILKAVASLADHPPVFTLPLARPANAMTGKDRSDFCENRHYHLPAAMADKIAAKSADADAKDKTTGADSESSDVGDTGAPVSRHTGLDYPVATGTPIHATANGIVVMAEDQFFTGNTVVVDHGDGLVTMVFHLKDIAVQPGQDVERGDQLGTAGATGRATGPHLHIGARWRDARIDPAVLFSDPAKLPGVGEGDTERKVEKEKEKVEKKTDSHEEAAKSEDG